jgi:hypothetical protein
VLAQAIAAEELTADKVAELTPLAVLLRIIRAAYQAGDMVAAQGPPVWRHMHARLSSSDIKFADNNAARSDGAGWRRDRGASVEDGGGWRAALSLTLWQEW